jgi:hypothetical protein
VPEFKLFAEAGGVAGEEEKMMEKKLKKFYI